MPRVARIKSPEAMYHVMSKSISEVDLFRDNYDKDKYLTILKKYMGIFKFKIYTYCLMDNHTHLLVDGNGADISKIFHGVNFSYAIYYNRKYKRHGHLFQGRFKSKIIGSNSYFARLSAYIHNNPITMEGYENPVEEYEYSSLGLYLGLRKDQFELVERGYLLTLFNSRRGLKTEAKTYLSYIKSTGQGEIESEGEFKDEKTRYVSGRKILYRDCNENKVAKFLRDKIKFCEGNLLMKGSKKSVEGRAIFSLFLKCFCNYKNRDIGGIIGNISTSSISMLCSRGLELIKNREEYQGLFPEFIKECMSI